ncbi:MAG TPA: bifunctional DNA-binding transcriptional regulator/O6-methylguanine-DNA methyltransferase Ada [Gemmatimonadaceae bacterium]|nr:bifunctional DNA-binding transcriptional regulator/O6-methylguanine-DNA methyltransferase Ada [Gemmatimonadaceae bacterium]
MTTAFGRTSSSADGRTTRTIADPEAWAAVAARDGTYDGAFVYAVRTTKVYCRPSCPARRPRREHVRFYGSPDAAEAEGYRACKRCRPRSTVATAAEGAVALAIAHIDAHLDEPVTLDALAAVAGGSPFHLQRTFKRIVGLSPRQYRDARRLERLKVQLRRGDTVSRATFEAGFGSSRAVYEKAGAGLGMSPAAYRRGGAGVRIRYALSPTRLGCLLVAATERGVCAVSLADSVEQLEAALRREFPNADLARDDGALAEWMAAIVEHVEGVRPRLTVPTDLEGTEFQLRVWRALQEIPYGSTRSYREVADAIGQPSAARAVARACATNRVALVVPCHRVVREDGSISGYRWGAERKRRLLDEERGGAARRTGGVAAGE